MKKRDIEKALRALGYWRVGGAKHDKWVNDRATIMVPRHREIKEHLARAILREALERSSK